MNTPSYWYAGTAPWYTHILAYLYGIGRKLHVLATRPALSPIPLICVGNITAGGAGKTPVVQALVTLLAETRGVHILSRGYGGHEHGPLRVTPTHTAHDVGDEALLLAASAPTFIARDRLAGAHAIARQQGRLIIMDDGLQNRMIRAHLNLLVVDGKTGFGNGHLIPAGPLREPATDIWQRVGAVIMIGDDDTNLKSKIPTHIPVFMAHTEYNLGNIDVDAEYVAFAGIGRPEKFFATLANIGLNVVATAPFPDHHVYTQREIEQLVETPKQQGIKLITTAKDAVKIPATYLNDGTISVLHQRLTFDAPDALRTFIETHLPRTDHF